GRQRTGEKELLNARLQSRLEQSEAAIDVHLPGALPVQLAATREHRSKMKDAIGTILLQEPREIIWPGQVTTNVSAFRRHGRNRFRRQVKQHNSISVR